MINISLPLMATVAVLFLVLLVLLNKMLFKPLLKHMDERNKNLQESLGSVNDNADEASRFLDEAKAILDQAKQEAASYKDGRVAKAKEEAEALLASEREKIDTELDRFGTHLEEERQELKNTLLGQAPLFKEGIKAKLATSA